MTGRDVPKWKCGRAIAQCGVQRLLSAFDKENLRRSIEEKAESHQ
jgi:hypothetical protein